MSDISATASGTDGREEGAAGAVFDYQKLVNASVWIFLACGAIGVIEPSPYDFASLVAMPLWFFGGFTVHRSFIVFGFLILAYTMTGFLALMPYWDNADSAMYQYQSGYLALTGLFFALFMGNRATERVEVCFKGFTAGSAIAAITGILGYFDLFGLGGELFAHAGRASGTFKDPNVLGSYVILAILYLAQNLLLARAKSTLFTSLTLLIVFSGMFLSFSRGSYGATVLAFGLMLASVFFTTKDLAMKRRIVFVAIAAVAMVAAVVLILLSIPETREIFFQRAAVTQEYDEGSTGRFGNQLRSIPMLLERFGGFGPLRFRLIFEIEPHNSYIGAFANNGWIGGFLFLLLVGLTAFIGLRMMFTATPSQRQAQVVVPALLALFLQGVQIDIDHWRHVFFMLGAVWGLEAARQRWAARQQFDVGRKPVITDDHASLKARGPSPPLDREPSGSHQGAG
jgi:hypothetical protein